MSEDQAHYTTFTLARGHRATEGHFPGNPILPGAALLDETLAALQTSMGTTSEVSCVKSAKFPSAARPGDRVDVRARRQGDGGIKLDCAIGAQSVLLAIVREGAVGLQLPSSERSETPRGGALDKPRIRALVPHSGPMCLLDEIVAWDERGLRGRACGHRERGHPLAREGRLHALSAIEYAAQAMAAHGALASMLEQKPGGGRLIGLRDVELGAHYLHDIAADLAIEVDMLAGDASGVIYGFFVWAGERPLVSGRATVILDAAQAGAQ